MSAYALHHHTLPQKPSKHPWIEKNPNMVPVAVQSALRQAMILEGKNSSDFNDLLWIMAQESGGAVDTRNGTSTARGLFQLLKAQYYLNPNGESSFGNPIEECQGGIRYIYARYKTAEAAKEFWMKHKWY
ncbi:transglycosylase SLT domain-containing protein [Acetobacter sp.]|jgi:SLT domain-containing protein|uniref:aggregation-promoting factor C-terminal-like domain-containing protein n=1 Tax=Acetobacter sp. TaxID=440 RepID=UPI0025C14547|nr:transglycosylase SLT domain-containing protein [Acetobacter sp.]MCH4090234.1 transglycosylase SLT domain-containing protein [Acetobacter sp.]MCI1298928.1 transglycosylase SLT domain-containing protein [Acetobacter sp.]MCI1314948.1 transglycosylase SLT domain-containing protein [Acetobacter sp.]